MRALSNILVTVLLLAAAGCTGPTKPYAGHSATTPESARATLECDGSCGRIVNLGTGREIDGKSVDRFFTWKRQGQFPWIRECIPSRSSNVSYGTYGTARYIQLRNCMPRQVTPTWFTTLGRCEVDVSGTLSATPMRSRERGLKPPKGDADALFGVHSIRE